MAHRNEGVRGASCDPESSNLGYRQPAACPHQEMGVPVGVGFYYAARYMEISKNLLYEITQHTPP